jgi:hypothetical protein
MLRLNVIQNQYVILALGCSIALMLIIVMTFLMLKRKRAPEFYTEDRQSTFRHTLEYIPWLIYLTWVSMFVIGIVYLIRNAIYPPNW